MPLRSLAVSKQEDSGGRPEFVHKTMTTAFWTKQSKRGLELAWRNIHGTRSKQKAFRTFVRLIKPFLTKGFTRWAVTGRTVDPCVVSEEPRKRATCGNARFTCSEPFSTVS